MAGDQPLKFPTEELGIQEGHFENTKKKTIYNQARKNRSK